MTEFDPRTVTLINDRLEGDAATGPYRPVYKGEKVDPEDVIFQTQDGEQIPYVPVIIYGNLQE